MVETYALLGFVMSMFSIWSKILKADANNFKDVAKSDINVLINKII